MHIIFHLIVIIIFWNQCICSIVIYEAVILIDDNNFLKYSKLGGLFRGEKTKHTIFSTLNFT
jgi:hypothetical protein